MTETLWLEQAVGHHVDGDLNRMEAEAVTAKIKAFAGVAWVLLNEAHQRKAHKAMGYASWGEYVEAEFDMSKAHSYRLISQARVVMEISEAAGVSPMGDITEREARDLLPVLDEAKAAVVEAVESLPAEATDQEKSTAAKDALLAQRSKVVPRPPEPKATGTQTTTITETKVFDPETGEIIEGGGEASPVAPPPSDPPMPEPTAEEKFREALGRAMGWALRLTTEFDDHNHNLAVQGQDRHIYLEELRALERWVTDALAAEVPTLSAVK